jgi:hypothetical protein
MKLFLKKSHILAAIMLAGTLLSHGQTDLPPVFRQGTIPEQLKYLDEHTRIYENYRAIREDIYRTVSRNILDSLNQSGNKISTLTAQTGRFDQRIDSLQKGLEAVTLNLEKATRTKNSIRLIGLEVNKTAYNTIVLIILAALVFLLVMGFLTFKVNLTAGLRTKKDLEDLKGEYEQYRTQSRLEREKMAIEHFNEIKRFKGK